MFTDDLPGSTIKPILASVFFQDGAAQDRLASALARSATDRFHDELFCLGARPGTLCDRPQRVQQRALALGWNADCDGRGTCGRADLLFGRRLTSRLDAEDTLNVPDAAPLQRGALVGRLFVDAEGTPMRLDRVDPSTAASCRDARGHWQASQCTNAAVKPLVNESAAQGQARTTALGLATMLTRLTAAADGVTAQRRPHRVARLTDAQGRTAETAATRVTGSGAHGAARALARAGTINVPPEAARAVLLALAQATAPGGTAHLSCRHVFGARCAEVARRFAGKTGTPSFSFDRLTLDQAGARCRARPGDDDCFERPMKLYVAAVQSRAGPPTGYDRVIAVITERNGYRADTGIPASVRARVHGGSNDVDNLATEIAMRIINDAWVSTAGR